jgi:Ca2+-binding EF-hand superfamily protein
MGKTNSFIFRLLDEDKANSLDPLDILNGLKNYIGVYLTRDETNKLSVHMDEDQSGDIDCNEFCEKITTENLNLRCEKFTISKNLFIEKMLTAWSFFKDRERRSLIERNAIFNHKN